MSIDAMKNALEALENPWKAGPEGVADAITALRTAIEQAEKQEPVAWMYVNEDMPTNRQLEWTETHHGYAGNWLKYPLYVAPPTAQKPVAYKWKGELFTPGEIEMLDVDDAVPLYAAPIESKQEPVAFRWKGDLFTNPVPLYEHPRQWVGLTENDIHEAFNFVELVKQISFGRETDEWCKNFAAHLSAKLKEKNA